MIGRMNGETYVSLSLVACLIEDALSFLNTCPVLLKWLDDGGVERSEEEDYIQPIRTTEEEITQLIRPTHSFTHKDHN
jgi:hypothetical protein